MGDLNIHHKSWLKFSREDTIRGKRLKEISENHGLRQLVNKPTRGDYLLDLVLCNDCDMKIKVGPKVADHHSILTILPDKMEIRDLTSHKVWHYKDAN